ncbi:hypothetical protein [Thermoplasma sp. Kam2015]|uniref:hypothetical protein n=1 Tax=Thermoplasma sp. Kam2015 TaxID=2094122 RepID=UPI00137AFDD3|nr:hypothetical protein [Thermoplasma sp. Kam2015]
MEKGNNSIELRLFVFSAASFTMSGVALLFLLPSDQFQRFSAGILLFSGMMAIYSLWAIVVHRRGRKHEDGS